MEFLPGASLQQLQLAGDDGNQAEYVPVVYGTCWIQPQAVFARNDSQTTHIGAPLAVGPIEGVLKVVANRMELPRYEDGKDLSASGWYRLVSAGERDGVASDTYLDSSGAPVDGPHGGIAYLEVTLPRSINTPGQLPRLEVLLQGLKLPRYDLTGAALPDAFSANPVWVLMDMLQRAGWGSEELDVQSFAQRAQYCDESIAVKDLQGADVFVPRFQCNLAIRKRRSMAELLRGLRYSCGLYVGYGSDGKLQLNIEGDLSLQQPTKPWNSNSASSLGSGWPAYEFGDGTNGTSGIVRLSSGAPSIRLWSRTAGDVPNRIRLEFDDEFNLYQRDSLTLADADDLARGGGNVAGSLPALGVTNFAHAQRALQVYLRRSVRGNLYVEFDTSVRGLGLRPGDLITVTYLKEGLNRRLFRVVRMSADLNMRTIHVVAQAHEDAWYSVSGSSIGGSGLQPGFGAGMPRPLVGDSVDSTGVSQFSVSEGTSSLSDGTGLVTLTVGYARPVRPSPRSRWVPWVSLAPQIHASGGSLTGGRAVYYGIAAVNGDGEEGPLSFVVRAQLPAGNSIRVQLSEITLPPEATGFNVYRGGTPSQLLRIASGIPTAVSFTDAGLPSLAIGPPDEYFDHANFYWRTELHPPVGTTFGSSGSIRNNAMSWVANEYRGQRVRIVAGTGAGQERVIVSNSVNSISVQPDWSITPDTTSQFLIAEGSWHFGSRTESSPAEFEVPNRRDAVVHVTGRAANSTNVESEEGLAPITRWTVGGSGGSGGDVGVPGAPLFGLSWRGKGTVEVVGIAFESLANTQSVESGTLTLHYFDELQGPPALTVSAPVSAGDTIIHLSAAGPAIAGSYIQIGSEVLRVEGLAGGGTQYQVSRGHHTTSASAHSTSARIYHLSRKVFVIPFPRMFFGSPASGAFAYPVYLPMARIASAEMFVTNQNGSSANRAIKLTGSQDYGLRTLSGGQFTIQVDGHLAIKDSIAPPLVVEDARAVRDVSAVVQQAPAGAPIQLRLKKNGVTYANLTVAAGATSSAVVSGLELPPLESGSLLTLDIVSVGQTAETTPGRDLTVTIRL